MLKRFAAVFLMLSMYVTVASAARTTTIAGTLTRVGPDMIEARMHDGQTTTLTITANTAYRKWIMVQPWQQDPRADARSLVVGQRVRVASRRRTPQSRARCGS